MTADAADAHRIAELHDRVIHHIFGSGLILAGLATYPGIDAHVAQRLLDVVDELDVAVHELQRGALLAATESPPAHCHGGGHPESVPASFSERLAQALLDEEIA